MDFFFIQRGHLNFVDILFGENQGSMVPRNACLANFMHRKQGGIREFNTALVPGLGVQVISVLEEEARRFTFPCLGRFVSVSRVCFLRSVPFRFPSFVLFFIFFV